MFAYRRATASLVLGGYQALGRGGGLVHFLIRLAIWHEIWRAIRAVWRIPTSGPVIVIVIVLALITLVILRRRGVRWPRRSRGGSSGATSSGLRDW